MSIESTSSGSTTNASDLIATLRLRAPRVAMALAGAQLALPMARSLHGKARDRRLYTVKVQSTDEIYDDLHEWVLSLLPADRQRSLIAWTARRRGDMEAAVPAGSCRAPESHVRLRYDGSREQPITLDGHRIDVEVTDGEEKDDGGWRKPAEIVFKAHSTTAQRVLVAQLEDVARRHRETKRNPRFYMLSKWGDWQSLDELAPRTLDSVVLPDGQIERLVGDVAGFLAAEPEYLRRSIPWHRGHLYEGPPGTGKTSVARAIASHLGMDVWYLPLADLDKDSGLLNAINRITPRSMLLLEDVDVFHAATMRNDDGKGVTLSGLLNALDGITTPHGLFTVLTTNTVDALDAALIRPGRVDVVEHFGLAGRGQIVRLLERWYDQPICGMAPQGLSPAEVVETCKRSATMEEALLALRAVGVTS